MWKSELRESFRVVFFVYKIMDIIEKLKDIPVQEKAELGDMTAVYYSKIAPSVKSVEYLNSNTGWIYACNNAIADEVAKTDFRLFKQNGKEVEELDNHPVLDVLNRANNFTTKYDLLWLIANYLYLTGEAPLFVTKQNGIPQQLFLLRPDRLTVVAGTGDELIGGYTYRNDKGSEIKIDYNDIVFIKKPDPRSTFRGQGILSALARVFDIEQYSEEYNKNYFFNAATPSLGFTTAQKLSVDQRDRFRKQIEQNYKGVTNAHKFLIMDSGLDAKPLQVSQRDMEFINQLNWTRDKILAVSRVPRTALGITDDVNRANAEATDYVFIKRTIYPLVRMVLEQLNEFFIPMFPDGDQIYLDFVNPITQDINTKIAYYNSGIQNGWLSVNEVRNLEGLDDIGEEGDKYRIGQADPYATIGQNSISKGYKRRIVKAIQARAKQTTKTYLKDLLKAEIKHKVQELRPEIKELIKANEDKRDQEANQWSYAEKEAEWQEIVKRADSYEIRFRNAVVKQFKDQASRLTRGSKSVIKTKDYLLNVEKEKSIWFRVFLPIYSDIVREQGQKTLNKLTNDLVFQFSRENIQKFIFNRTTKIAKDLNDYTNERIKRVLADNVSENEEVIGRKIRQLFNDMSVDRAKTIARTETFKAVGYATNESYKQSGVVVAKEWFTALDERVCEFCASMEGKQVKLDDNFFDKGDTVVGEDGGEFDADYNSIDTPPLHPDCRCSLAPVLVGRRMFSEIIAKKKEEQKQFDISGVHEKINEVSQVMEEAKSENKETLEKGLDLINQRLDEIVENVNKKVDEVKSETDQKINKIVEDIDEVINE